MSKGKRLERLIEESPYKNISQFSKVSKVPYTTIKSFIERDLHKAGVDNVFKVARTLGVSVDYLISDETDSHVDKEEQKDYITNKSNRSSYHYLPTSISAGLPL